MKNCYKSSVILFLILILVWALPSRACWSENGVVVCTASGYQSVPQIVTDGVGGAIIAWFDSRVSAPGIYAQRIDWDGYSHAGWPEDGVAISTASGTGSNKEMTSDGAGGAIITWRDSRNGNDDIYAQRIDEDGDIHTGWPVNGVAVCTATLNQWYPSITSDGVGGAIITWYDFRTGGSANIYAQRIDGDGGIHAGWPENGVAVCTAPWGQYFPRIISDGAGGAIITWEDDRTESSGDIYAQRIDGDGSVHPGWPVDGIAICTVPGNQLRPQITSDGAGGAIITWEDNRGIPTSYGIYAQRIDGDGSIHAGWPVDGVAIFMESLDLNAGSDLLSDDAGGIIITWGDTRNGNLDIYAQRIDGNGSVHAGWPPDGLAICAVTGDQKSPRIISDGISGSIITWEDMRGGGSDIYCQRIDGDGSVHVGWPTNGIAICSETAAMGLALPQITSDGVDGAIVTWRDDRDVESDIYAFRLTGEGEPPPPLEPPPNFDLLYPSSGYTDATLALVVGGANFLDGSTVDLGEGITVESATFESSETLRVDISIDRSATIGFRDVIVNDRCLRSDTLVEGFEVLASMRHYMSPTGANIYPYATPFAAATDLSDAVTAADEGDSVLVASTSLNGFSFILEKNVGIYGAWINNFTSRNLASGKTVLDLMGNITVSAANGAVIDGFIIQNGTGGFYSVPQVGYYGGGVWILDATATVSNCEIRSNQAQTGFDFGGGAGIAAHSSTVNIQNNHIWNNTAEHGGGIYLYDCDGTVDDNTISENLAQLTVSTPYGAGIYLLNSTGLSLNGNTIERNTGAERGGGIYIKNSSGVVVDGGVFSRNQCSFGGAGVSLEASEVMFEGVQFVRNSSALLGGAVEGDTSSVTIETCEFLWNAGLIGAGIYVNAGDLYLRHNLFVGNEANNAGAVYAFSLSDGNIIGNTIDRNTADGGVGGIKIASSSIEVFNNIVVNTGGAGISCSGSPTPTLRFNNVWNSSGADYDGCTPGVGSISMDPLLADTSEVDYHFTVHSPAIDAGDPSSTYDDPDGSRGDMGWYNSHSFVMEQPSYPKNLVAAVISGDVELSWDKNPEPDIEKYAVYCDSFSGFVPGVSNFVQFVMVPDTSVNMGAYTDTVYYVVSAVDTSGYGSGFSGEAFPIATGFPGRPVVYRTRLNQNFPNPFNPMTNITYELEARVPVKIDIYDVQGRLIRRLVNTKQGPGEFAENWDGRNFSGENVSSGVYFYRLKAGSKVLTRKMVVIK